MKKLLPLILAISMMAGFTTCNESGSHRSGDKYAAAINDAINKLEHADSNFEITIIMEEFEDEIDELFEEEYGFPASTYEDELTPKQRKIVEDVREKYQKEMDNLIGEYYRALERVEESNRKSGKSGGRYKGYSSADTYYDAADEDIEWDYGPEEYDNGFHANAFTANGCNLCGNTGICICCQGSHYNELGESCGCCKGSGQCSGCKGAGKFDLPPLGYGSYNDPYNDSYNDPPAPTTHPRCDRMIYAPRYVQTEQEWCEQCCCFDYPHTHIKRNY